MLKFRGEIGGVTREIIGAGIEVHRILGPGYLEAIYQRAMIRELVLAEFSFRPNLRLMSSTKENGLGDIAWI